MIASSSQTWPNPHFPARHAGLWQRLNAIIVQLSIRSNDSIKTSQKCELRRVVLYWRAQMKHCLWSLAQPAKRYFSRLSRLKQPLSTRACLCGVQFARAPFLSLRSLHAWLSCNEHVALCEVGVVSPRILGMRVGTTPGMVSFAYRCH